MNIVCSLGTETTVATPRTAGLGCFNINVDWPDGAATIRHDENDYSDYRGTRSLVPTVLFAVCSGYMYRVKGRAIRAQPPVLSPH